MSKPTRSITIEFERMPHSRCNPVKIEFFRDGASIQAVVYRDVFAGKGKATCHPTDTFSWETGMRLCVKRMGDLALYRAFRRWMWLAKAAHECNRQKDSCFDWLIKSAWDPVVNIDHEPIETIIAREFGRVTVRVT